MTDTKQVTGGQTCRSEPFCPVCGVLLKHHVGLPSFCRNDHKPSSPLTPTGGPAEIPGVQMKCGECDGVGKERIFNPDGAIIRTCQTCKGHGIVGHFAVVSLRTITGGHACFCGYGQPHGVDYEQFMRHYVSVLVSACSERIARLESGGPAEIPADLRELYEDSESAIQKELIERIARLESGGPCEKCAELKLQKDYAVTQAERWRKSFSEAEAECAALRDALEECLDHIQNGRLCYFGDHIGYQTQFGSSEVLRWRAALEGAKNAEQR